MREIITSCQSGIDVWDEQSGAVVFGDGAQGEVTENRDCGWNDKGQRALGLVIKIGEGRFRSALVITDMTPQ